MQPVSPRGMIVLVLVLLGSNAQAQSWVDSVLPERSFDMGTVARGSKVRHSFVLANRLDQPVRILNWQTKCGCTEVKVGAKEIPPGTQTVIEAVIDTTKFVGHKPSGLKLILGKPSYAEVDLNLSCFIRGDLTLTPGSADLGVIARAAGAAKPSVTLRMKYVGGYTNWGITKIQTKNPKLVAKAEELSRTQTGQVEYLLTATLDPSDLNGYFKDEITLFTNDASSPTIPVSVTANIQAAFTVSPSPLILGPLKPGQVVKKTLLVRSAQSFKLTGVTPSNEDFASAGESNDVAKPLHTVNLTFTAPTVTGPYHSVIEIATDLKDEPPARITAFANVVP